MDISDVVQLMISIIAFLALGISLWQMFEQRKHNRIAFRPALATSTHGDVKNMGGDSTMVLSFFVKNHGMGPAEIESAIVQRESITYRIDGSQISGIRKVIDDALIGKFEYEIMSTSNLAKNMIMPSKDERRLFKVLFKKWNPKMEIPLFALMDEFELVITYRSAYGESFKMPKDK